LWQQAHVVFCDNFGQNVSILPPPSTQHTLYFATILVKTYPFCRRRRKRQNVFGSANAFRAIKAKSNNQGREYLPGSFLPFSAAAVGTKQKIRLSKNAAGQTAGQFFKKVGELCVSLLAAAAAVRLPKNAF
jgi:hypothetical protein